MRLFLIDFPLDFWKRHPALLIGLLTLLGTASALAWHPLYGAVLLCMLLPFLYKRTFTLSFLCAIAACLLAFATSSLRISSIHLPDNKIQGTGRFRIDKPPSSHPL